MVFGLPTISEDFYNSIYVEILPVSYGFKEVPMNVLNIHENLLEVLLKMGNYTVDNYTAV